MIYRFHDLELDTALASLRRGGADVALEPRVFSLLRCLVENRDRVVPKETLVEAVWDGRFISDDAISTAIKELRRAMGDDGRRQNVVKTLRGRGYRFVAPVRMIAHAPKPAEDTAPLMAGRGAAGRPSIAILPFHLVGPSRSCAAIADAIPAELISSLSRLRWLKVFARGSCFRFRDDPTDPATVRAALGANYCLSGVIEMFERDIAITVELTDTCSKSVVWCDRITGVFDDVHEMRATITGHVVTAMDLHIPMHEAEAARLRAPKHLDAWGLYHIGLQHMYRFNKADNERAAAYLARAAALEPGFARVQAARSFTSFQNAFLNYTADRAAQVADARRFAEHSVELDPLDPFGNFTLARSYWLEGDPEHGRGWLDRAVDYSPSFAHGHYARGWSAAMAGRSQDARRDIDTALQLSPLDPFQYAMQATRAFAHLIEGDTAAAASWADQAARAPGAHYLIGLIAAMAHQLDGNEGAAAYWAGHASARRPGASVDRFFKAFPFTDASLRGTMADALERTGIPR
ncbi:winged helix-turn-helix domain-containing protein [Roseovarius salis]|uniref:winged helix-turn-helix domain-containing protein n=1 Tax=Roseovarius salis TaxID=3376063 RepID=UPI0037C856F8